jgi:hypothetical protein
MSPSGRFCCKRQLKVFWVSDSVAVMRFATGAEHDGAAQSRPGATVSIHSTSMTRCRTIIRYARLLQFFDLSWVHAELATYYPRFGRPSIDPVLMIRILAWVAIRFRASLPTLAPTLIASLPTGPSLKFILSTDFSPWPRVIHRGAER